MNKLQKIKDDYCPYDQNYNLFPSEIQWLIEQAEKFEKLAFDYDDLTSKIEELKKEVEGWKQDSEMYQDYLDREKNLCFISNEKCKDYEDTLRKIVKISENGGNWLEPVKNVLNKWEIVKPLKS